MTCYCEFCQRLPNCSHSLQQRVPSFVPSFPPLTLLSAHDSVHHMHNQVLSHELHTSILALVPGNRKEPSDFFSSNRRGAALGVAPIPTPTLQKAPAGVAQPLLCPSSSPLNRSNFLSMLYWMAEISFCLQTPWLLPDLQLWSLINYYSADNFRESDRERRGKATIKMQMEKAL